MHILLNAGNAAKIMQKNATVPLAHPMPDKRNRKRAPASSGCASRSARRKASSGFSSAQTSLQKGSISRASLFRRRRARVGGRSGDHLGAQRGNLPRGYSMRLICHHADHADQPLPERNLRTACASLCSPIFIMAAVEQHKRLRLKHLQPRPECALPQCR